MPSKFYASSDKNICVSCGACAVECPRGAIEIWKGCYAVIDKNICVGCGLCKRICPANCIEFLNRETEEN